MSQGLGRLIFFLFNFQRKASRRDEECWGIERKIKKKICQVTEESFLSSCLL